MKRQMIESRRLSRWTHYMFKVRTQTLWYDSFWYKWYVFPDKDDDFLKQLGTTTFDDRRHMGKLFRIRFRVPFSLFVDLLFRVRKAETEKDGILYRGQHNASFAKSYPVELLLLGALRMLAFNVTFDLIAEVTSISSETHRRWFYK